jgi:hypothetical protein
MATRAAIGEDISDLPSLISCFSRLADIFSPQGSAWQLSRGYSQVVGIGCLPPSPLKIYGFAVEAAVNASPGSCRVTRAIGTEPKRPRAEV